MLMNLSMGWMNYEFLSSGAWKQRKEVSEEQRKVQFRLRNLLEINISVSISNDLKFIYWNISPFSLIYNFKTLVSVFLSTAQIFYILFPALQLIRPQMCSALLNSVVILADSTNRHGYSHKSQLYRTICQKRRTTRRSAPRPSGERNTNHNRTEPNWKRNR